MDLSNRALEFSATITPRLVSGLPTHYDAGNTSDQSCLHHPSPGLLGSQALETYDTIEEQEERIDGFRKVKMFEMAPSADPELEERRQRAIYAKNNRNTKKRELENLQHDSSALRTANTQCQANLTRMHGVIEDQQRKIEQLEEWVSDTCHQLRDKDEQIRNSQIKLSHLKAHLELIADGLDDNMSRRLLLNLLAQS
ncbi:uncharacterized protein LOC123518314 [Portunus trituberculatus]|uniref:uncharacterized protein LOC123518314 n=1 Tax=Portunus trituberculatus TaxID=210409 RepID=UPI001E1D075E|nr:uncharacterized protein LOC123518314 [Portunus trituberculatus]